MHTKLRTTYEVRVERRSVIGPSPFHGDHRTWALFARYPNRLEAEDAAHRALDARVTKDVWDFAEIVQIDTFERNT